MNLQALFDGILALVAIWVAVSCAKHWPALRLGSLILASAAVLGTLRFSGLLPLPPLHQFISMLGASVGLPLVGITLAMPGSATARHTRYAWIFAVVSAVIAVLVVMMAQFKLWASLCAVLAAVAMLFSALKRRDWLALASGAFILSALIAFASKVQMANLSPGDLLHIGLAIGLGCVGTWARARVR